MTKRVCLYARTSTDGQTTDNQINELREIAARHDWVVVQEFIDHGISGAKGRDQRPAFDQMLKSAVRKEFDMILAWSVDRLGRSMQHLLNFLDEINAKNIGLYLHQQGIDTNQFSSTIFLILKSLNLLISLLLYFVNIFLYSSI